MSTEQIERELGGQPQGAVRKCPDLTNGEVPKTATETIDDLRHAIGSNSYSGNRTREQYESDLANPVKVPDELPTGAAAQLPELEKAIKEGDVVVQQGGDLVPWKLPKTNSTFSSEEARTQHRAMVAKPVWLQEALGGPYNSSPSQFQTACERTYTKDFKQPTQDQQRLLNAATGIAGEAGELSDLVKKHVFHEHPLTEEMKKKFFFELGDTLYYLAVMATTLGFSIEDVMAGNVEKLRKRYPDGFSSERSINRDPNQT